MGQVSDPTLAAMDELRRVCGGDRAPKGFRNYIGTPSNDPRPATDTTSVDWVYTAIVALLASAVGGLVYLMSLP